MSSKLKKLNKAHKRARNRETMRLIDEYKQFSERAKAGLEVDKTVVLDWLKRAKAHGLTFVDRTPEGLQITDMDFYLNLEG